jgi:hypothetical protein
MRSSNISGLFSLALVALVVGCSSNPGTSDAGGDAAAPGCVVEFAGNLTDEASRSTCATVAADDAGGYTLSIDTSTSQIARVQMSIALGSAPTPGQSTNESVTDWSAIALESANACFFQAGATSVPNGSFTLDLTAFDAKASTAHGTLTITAYVHAPPTTDCSYDDLETITIHF